MIQSDRTIAGQPLILARKEFKAKVKDHGLLGQVADRSWNYVTLGYGHNESWWRDFVTLLAQVGYNDVLSIEHEDTAMSPMEGMRRSVELLQRVIIREAAH